MVIPVDPGSTMEAFRKTAEGMPDVSVFKLAARYGGRLGAALAGRYLLQPNSELQHS